MKKFLLLTSVVAALYALTPAEYAKAQQASFSEYKQSQEDAFNAYQKEQEAAFNAYKEELAKVWNDPKLSSKKSWIEYTQNKKTRTDVNFEKGTIEVETIATSLKEAQKELKVALAKAVTVDTKTVQEQDPLEKRLRKIKKPKGVVDAPVKAEPILAPIIFTKKPTQKSVKTYVEKKVKPRSIHISKKSKVPKTKIYSVKIQLPKNSVIKRSKIYYTEVKRQASKQKIPLSLVFAIMHSESSFNPRARSHIPAYGLMQIVPKTAGIDTYRYLYNKKKLVTGSYLYDSTNNITMGSAYLHILYYRYLRSIKDPVSKMYCTIAAYNTGAGNIAYAFTGKYNMKKAAPIINAMTSDEVYAKLMKDLRWDEPKHYLKKVSRRMKAYKQIYGS